MRSVDKEDFLKVECTPCAFSGVTFTAEQVSSLVRAFVALPREARLAMGKAPVSPGSSGRVGSAPDRTPWLDAPLLGGLVLLVRGAETGPRRAESPERGQDSAPQPWPRASCRSHVTCGAQPRTRRRRSGKDPSLRGSEQARAR